MPNEERKKHRFHQSEGGSVRPRMSLTQYRVLYGPRIRRYYSTGDPVQDRMAGFNLFKLILILLLIAGVVFLLIMAISRMGG